MAHLLLADGNEGGEEIDDALKVTCAASRPDPLVMERVKAMPGFCVKDDKVFLAPAFLGVPNPIACLFRLGREDQAAHAGYS